MNSLLFLVAMGMSVCSSSNLPSDLSKETRADGEFIRFIEAEDYPAVGSEAINGERSNITKRSVRTKRQSPFNPAVVGHGLDGLDAGLTILDALLKLPGKCCPNLVPKGNWCIDGTKGTPYCAYGACNIQGCNCDGGCRRPPDDNNVAVVFEDGNYNLGISNGADKAFKVDSWTCVNFGYFNDKITGIAPMHGCVRVWEHANCEGAAMCVCKPISNLAREEMRDGTSWNDQISSMNKC